MKRIVYTFPLISLSLLIFYLSHQSQPPTPDLGFAWQDKFYHCLAYFVYGITAILALSSYLPQNKAILWAVVILGCLYGASDEFHQSFVPGRSSEFADWCADVVGIMLSTLMISKLAPWIRRQTTGYLSSNPTDSGGQDA